MSDDRYRQIFEDFGQDLLAVAKRHGKRALREAVRDAAHGNLLQEDEQRGEDEDVIPPKDLDYPDESVWTLPPAPEDEEEGDGEEESDSEDKQNADDEHELSDAAEKVVAELAERLERRMRK